MRRIPRFQASAGAVAPRGRLAERRVYLRAPGTVVRCDTCASVLVVITEIRGIACVDLRGLDRLDLTE